MAAVPEKIKDMCFTDCHCHLIPGLDDGPTTVEEAVEMARGLSSFGFSEIVCTPHIVQGVYEFEPVEIKKAVLNFQKVLHKEAIPLLVRPAAEYRFDEFLLNFLAVPLPICEDLILVDAHPLIQPNTLLELAYLIITKSRMRPLIAHPERYDFLDEVINGRKESILLSFFKSWKLRPHDINSDDHFTGVVQKKEHITDALREMGCLFQGSIGSFAGIYGEHVLKRAIKLLRSGYYDRLGTDAHHARDLIIWLSKGINSVLRITGEEGLIRLLRPLETLVA